jgi:Ankyrin repeat
MLRASPHLQNTLGDASYTDLGAFTWTPLHCAAFYIDREMIDVLIDYGANPELPDTLYKSVS